MGTPDFDSLLMDQWGWPMEASSGSIGAAGNIIVGTNPAYALADFLAFYPMFGDIDSDGHYDGQVPQVVITAYIALASASLMQARWQEAWPIAMAELIAHFCTLYLRCAGSIDVSSPVAKIVASNLQKGIQVSKSEGPLSASIQVPAWTDDWGDFQQTSHGMWLLSHLPASVFAGAVIW